MSLCHPSVGLLQPELRQHLARYLRRRLPPADAEDALQAVYCAALEAQSIPGEPEHLRRWLTVIARRQIAAYYKRSSTEQLGEPPEVDVLPGDVESLSLLRWVERQAAQCKNEEVDQTLDWMARESDGEKLEAIAAETRIPSASVRQRVFRLRRFMKARWALEISAAVFAVAIASWVLSRRAHPVTNLEIVPIPTVSVPLPIVSANNLPNRSEALRKMAFQHCDENRFDECLRLLDEAAALDPKGETDPMVTAARNRATIRIAPPILERSAPMPTTTSTTRRRSVTSGTPSSVSTSPISSGP
jgi:DNA-directed RNA polymerase specialized sigma24 family protein